MNWDFLYIYYEANFIILVNLKFLIKEKKMSSYSEIKNLKKKIVATRARMNELWNQRGYTDEEILAVSIELDQLINQYQRLQYKSWNQKVS